MLLFHSAALSTPMISNYFKMAFRVFMKNGIQTLINIFGLAIGISFSIVIFLYAHKEINPSTVFMRIQREFTGLRYIRG